MASTLAQRRRRWATPRAIFALMLREMTTTYGRSPGGYVWLVLEPVAAIALLSFAFSLALRAPSIGTNFPFFYATAFLPFMLYNQASTKLSYAIRYSQGLLTFPMVTFIDALTARFLLNVIIYVLVSFLILGGIILVWDLDPVIEPLRVLNSFGMALALAAGLGAMNCYLFVAFPAWIQLWKIINRPLFIVSGIFFIYEDLPGGLRDILLINPLFHVTAEMRAGFYGTYDADYVVSVYPYSVGAVGLFFGLLLLYRHHDEILWK